MYSKTFLPAAAALLLAACSPQEQPSAQESAPVSAANPQAAAPQPPAASASAAPSAGCTNLHRAEGIDDLMRQIADNIDTPCLFERPTDELAGIWGIIGSGSHGNIHAELFPELDPNAPDYQQRVSEEIQKLARGQRQVDPALVRRLQAEHAAVKQSESLCLTKGSSTSSAPGTEPRTVRKFSICTTERYRARHGGFGGSFQNIRTLPAYLTERGNFVTGGVFRLFNRNRSPNLPYLEIRFEPESGRITRITIYEGVENLQSGIEQL